MPAVTGIVFAPVTETRAEWLARTGFPDYVGRTKEEQLSDLAAFYGKPVDERGRPVTLTDQNPGWAYVLDLPWNLPRGESVTSGRVTSVVDEECHTCLEEGRTCAKCRKRRSRGK